MLAQESTPTTESDSDWTEEETEQLVEAIAEHQNDWESITMGFVNKTAE